MTLQELESKARAYRQWLTVKEEAEAEAETIRDEIKAHMATAQEIRAGEYKITYAPITTRRIDTAALKQAMPDIAAAFTKETTTHRFIIQ